MGEQTPGTVELASSVMPWEYLLRRLPWKHELDLGREMNELGANGWELAAVVDGVLWVFKRPAVEPNG